MGNHHLKPVTPTSINVQRLVVASALLAAAIVGAGVVLHQYVAIGLDQITIMGMGVVVYALLAISAIHPRIELPIGLQHIAVMPLFLAAGVFPVLVAAVLGATIAHFLRSASIPGIQFNRATIQRTSIWLGFDAGLSIGVTLVAGVGYVALGGEVGLATLTSSDLAAAVVYLVLSAGLHVLVLVGTAYPALGTGQMRRKRLREFGTLFLTNLLISPLAVLIGIGYNAQMPPLLWLSLHLLPVIAAIIFRASYHAQAVLEDRLHGLEIAQHTRQALASGLTLSDLLTNLYEHLHLRVHPQQCYVALYSSQALKLVYPLVMVQGQRSDVPPGELSRRLAEQVIKNRQPMLLRGSVRHTAIQLGLHILDSTDYACYLGVPLVVDKGVIGVIALQDAFNAAAFTEEHVALLSIMAEEAAPLLRNADQYTQVFELADSLALLNNVSTVVSATMDLNTILDTICNVIIEVGRADKIGIFLTDEQRLRLEFQLYLSDAFVARFPDLANAPDSGPQRALQQWTVQVVEDVQADPNGAGWRSLAEVEPFVSLLTVPLISDNRVIGLVAAFYSHHHQFSPSELDLFNTLANQVAVTVSNARLHQDTQRRAEELATLVEYSRSFTSTLDPHDVIRSVLDAISALIAPDMVVLLEAPAMMSGPPLNVMGQRGTHPLDALPPTPEMEQVFSTRQPILLRQAEERPDDLLTHFGLKSMYIVPLVSQDEAFGLALVGYRQQLAFDERKRQLAQAIFNQASTAIKNAQLFSQVDEALDQRVNELYAIAALSRKVSASLDLDEIVDEVLYIAIKVTNADLAGFALAIDSDPAYLKLVQHYNPLERLMRSVMLIPRDQGIIGQALRTGQSVMLGDVRNHPAYMPAPLPGLRSELAVPVIYKGTSLGVINLESRRLDAFTPTHRSFVTLMAEHIGVTLNNATLFTERRVQIENLIELRNLSLKLLSTTRFQDALRLLVMYTMTIMRARDVHLYLYDKDADHLTFGASMWADGRENLEAYKPTLSGRTWRVAHTGHMLLIPDTTKDKATSDVVDPHLFGAVALVPLKRGDEVFGVLLLTFRDPQFFDDGKVRTLELISSQAAIAIENARLFEEVRTRREQLEVVINASRDGIGLLDAQGRLVLVNQSAERLLDRSLQHFVGRSVLRVLASLRRSEQVRQLSEDFVTGMRRTLKLVEAHPDQPTKHIFAVSTPGGQRDLEARSLPVLDEAGHPIVRLVVLRDVSEEKAEERFREEVTNMLVHDLRAPTGSMITSLHMILDLIDTKEFDELGFVAQIALEGGERLMELINLLLELARADALDTREVPLNHVLQSAIFTLEASIKDANITVINQVTDAFPSLKVDESKVNRVFVNLLDNALRHTPTGGQVRFNAEVVTEKHGDYAKISVIDTGRGIPPEYRSKIFEKFVQVPKSSVRGQKGTGLGLTFCQKIVEAHGGKIWVDSGPEGGAAFWLTLPLVSRDSQQAEPQTPPQTPPDQATAAD